MPNIKVLKEPGFLYDLHFLFYANFNPQICIENLEDESKRESYKKYLKEVQAHFGNISDDLYVFYHALKNDRCFMTTYYMDPYKEQFVPGFDFQYLKSLLCDTEQLKKNLIQFYLYNLSKEELQECYASFDKLFSCIKASNYSGEEKSKLYEFFINPTPYFQVLQYELMEKELLLASYYKEHYHKIIEAHNNTTFEVLCAPMKGEKDLSFLNDTNQTLYTSFCLLNKYCMKFSFVSEGVIYLLGYDYVSIVNALVHAKKKPPLQDMCAVLGDLSRVQILKLLLEKEEIICKDLEKIFQISGSTAYHHIVMLAKIGALKVRNEGKTIYYSLNRKYFDEMITQLKLFSND